jgi:hypothetical protein
MHPDSEPCWYLFSCPVPARPTAADAYLTQGLGPVLDGLPEAHWSFVRKAPGSIEVYVWGRRPTLLAARLAGLSAAARVPAPVRRRVATAPYPAGQTPVNLALELIRSTPARRARLSMAVDLAMVAAVQCCPAVDRVHQGRPDHARQALGPRWLRVAETLGAEAHPLARWGRVVRTGPAPEAFAKLHLMHNQLGLSEDDEQRVHATLVRSLTPTRGPVRRTTDDAVPHRVSVQRATQPHR